MFNKNIFGTTLLLIFLLNIVVCSQQVFYVDVNDREDDVFYVKVIPHNLTAENNTYYFAASAPGTYQIMDIGRFVQSFKAYDENGAEIAVEHSSVNQWVISEPQSVKSIVYIISETWDTKVEEHPIYRMGGTSIEEDHVLINGQCVFGFFKGRQKDEILINIGMPDNWELGTALPKNNDGYFVASNYDQIVDSPILMGRLSKETTNVSGSKIDIYTYSKTDKIKSSMLLDNMKDMLDAASKFTVGLPVDHYTFLFHFEDVPAGAWEHSYSSIYVMAESELNERYLNRLRATAAHEFFHIITPLNIHSELIENFNFVKPQMSQHIWLYESTTEWASDIMQLRDSIINVNSFLRQLKQKLTQTDYFDNEISLTELSLQSMERQDQFYLFYCKGAVIVTLLDMELMKLSDGERGLREVILDLMKDYGKDKSFSEDTFFDDFVQRTYPEIGDFIDNYIKGNNPLPFNEIMNDFGILYYPEKGYDSTRAGSLFSFDLIDTTLVINKIFGENNYDIKVNDVLFKVDDKIITKSDTRTIFMKLRYSQPGDEIKLTMKRDDKLIDVNYEVPPRKIKHVFEVDKNSTPAQLRLRNKWARNLEY